MSFKTITPAPPRLNRSELAVPGSQPGLFVKAADSEADVVFLDLEDAVAPGDKEQARKNVIHTLLEIDWRERGKTVCVRINGIDTPYMYRDVVDVVEQAGHRLDVLLVPKVGVAADVMKNGTMSAGISSRIGIVASVSRNFVDRGGGGGAGWEKTQSLRSAMAMFRTASSLRAGRAVGGARATNVTQGR